MRIKRLLSSTMPTNFQLKKYIRLAPTSNKQVGPLPTISAGRVEHRSLGLSEALLQELPEPIALDVKEFIQSRFDSETSVQINQSIILL